MTTPTTVIWTVTGSSRPTEADKGGAPGITTDAGGTPFIPFGTYFV